ncbi:MAG: monooxygenase [Rhodomicrobium sp.]|nr:MAG: monooxygenase [Rhodomicrobium sp.]
MAALLLARSGVKVVVLEKHKDFLRDFRGDTIHPSTLELMHELGWLSEFLELPHQKVPQLAMQFGEARYQVVDFSHLSVKAPYIAMMPQWDFLNFLDNKAQAYSGYQLLQSTEALELLEKDGVVVGVKAMGPLGEVIVKAPLTLAADGRDSTLRQQSGLKVQDFGAPMDVLWFRLSRQVGDGDETFGRLEPGQILIMLNRGDYWQCAFVIPKGADADLRHLGLATFKQRLSPLLPFSVERLKEIENFDSVKTLQVQVNRMERWWKPGFLCIGDAAHAMSPVGGVGVNLAVQDAVAAAKELAMPLRDGVVSTEVLAAIEKRRAFPAKVTQKMQILVQNNLIKQALSSKAAVKPPLMVRLFDKIPLLRRIPARIIGLGIRPEHISEALIKGRDD